MLCDFRDFRMLGSVRKLFCWCCHTMRWYVRMESAIRVSVFFFFSFSSYIYDSVGCHAVWCYVRMEATIRVSRLKIYIVFMLVLVVMPCAVMFMSGWWRLAAIRVSHFCIFLFYAGFDLSCRVMRDVIGCDRMSEWKQAAIRVSHFCSYICVFRLGFHGVWCNVILSGWWRRFRTRSACPPRATCVSSSSPTLHACRWEIHMYIYTSS